MYPRDDVIKGEMTESVFATQIAEVVAGCAAPVYQDPAVFFEHTYQTAGLRTLLKEAFEGLAGREGSPFIRLETSFCGGKTHNLIAVYRVARSDNAISGVGAFMPADLVPEGPVNVAAVIGNRLDRSTASTMTGIRCAPSGARLPRTWA